MGSDDYGRDLTGVQNLKKKHKRLEAELASHEPAIQSVQEAGEKLMDVSNLGVPEIEQASWAYMIMTHFFYRRCSCTLKAILIIKLCITIVLKYFLCLKLLSRKLFFVL